MKKIIDLIKSLLFGNGSIADKIESVKELKKEIDTIKESLNIKNPCQTTQKTPRKPRQPKQNKIEMKEEIKKLEENCRPGKQNIILIIILN